MVLVLVLVALDWRNELPALALLAVAEIPSHLELIVMGLWG